MSADQPRTAPVYGPVVDDPDEPTTSGEEAEREAAEPATTSAVTEREDAWAAPVPPMKSAIDRLSDGPPADTAISWLVTLAITALAFLVRLPYLGRPKNLVFDETYYPKDAWAMLQCGYEAQYVDKANDLIRDGAVNSVLKEGCQSAYVVHPPLGKWLIAAGEHLFGMNSFGWRFPSLVFGTLMVLVVIRLARRLGRSTLVGGIAGLLLTFDGLHFVMSRTGLLDIFQAFFIVAGVACVVADRDWFRHRLARHLTKAGVPDLDGRFGPALVLRPWRLAAGVMFGCGIAVKWNTMFALAAMGVMSVLWDISARKLAGARARAWWALLRDGIPAFISMVLLAIPVYVATWWQWFATQGGHGRQWGAQHPDSPLVKWFGKPLASLMMYHREVYNFHTGDYMASQSHTYEANPWGWLVLQRTIGIDAVNGIKPGEQGCSATGSDTCLRIITGLGTPTLWWMALVALVLSGWFWAWKRDWRFSVPLVALLSTWLPWFKYADRPLFVFYAITLIPFSVIALALCLGKLIGRVNSVDRKHGSWVAGGLIALVIANFAFFYPIYTDQLMTRKAWLLRMWLSGWI